ncbi:unnamed protein product [Parnassius mnemosyne]|uniref:PBZ-type domain-containing protein n=1 Tax=Parnassius mnemosyne TaxID=213953 RepID=A0AAV1K9T0_9NEOP
MSEEWLNFVNDPRTTCKYGAKCYQKNPEHHKNYKHPPQGYQKKIKNIKHKNKGVQPYTITKKHSDKDPTKKLVPSPSQDFSVNKQEKKNDDSEKEEEKKNSSLVTLDENCLFYDKTEDNKLFKELFLVEMPPDFFQFYKCISEEPSVEQTLASVNLQLIGPYDLLLGRLPMLDNKDFYLIHWRFFYDPPEFQAVLKKKGESGFHIGYFRDDPNKKPEFMATNDCSKDCHIHPVADNIFGAVYCYLQNEKKTSPFMSMACQKLMDKVKKWANEHKFSLDEYNIKKRVSQTVAKTLHGAGIVVPYNKKTELGYRPLVESNANLKKLFAKLESSTSKNEKDDILSQIQPVITYASIAMDECDFGTGLEIGIDLFCSGLKELEANAVASLTSAYSLLNRDAFGKIAQVHLKHRRKGSDMSIF